MLLCYIEVIRREKLFSLAVNIADQSAEQVLELHKHFSVGAYRDKTIAHAPGEQRKRSRGHIEFDLPGLRSKLAVVGLLINIQASDRDRYDQWDIFAFHTFQRSNA